MHPSRTYRRLLLSTVLAFGLSGAALAQQVPAVGKAEKATGQPVLLSADSVDYDEDLGIITARGKVELSQGGRLLLADSVSFSEKTNVVTASGNVSIMEPTTGMVIFSRSIAGCWHSPRSQADHRRNSHRALELARGNSQPDEPARDRRAS